MDTRSTPEKNLNKIQIDFALISHSNDRSAYHGGGYQNWNISKGYNNWKANFSRLSIDPELLFKYNAIGYLAKNESGKLFIAKFTPGEDNFGRAIYHTQQRIIVDSIIYDNSLLKELLSVLKELISSKSILDPVNDIFKDLKTLPVNSKSIFIENNNINSGSAFKKSKIFPDQFFFWVISENKGDIDSQNLLLEIIINMNADSSAKFIIAKERPVNERLDNVLFFNGNDLKEHLKKCKQERRNEIMDSGKKTIDDLSGSETQLEVEDKDEVLKNPNELILVNNSLIRHDIDQTASKSMPSTSRIFCSYFQTYHQEIEELFPLSTNPFIFRKKKADQVKCNRRIFDLNSSINNELTSHFVDNTEYVIKTKYFDLFLRFHIYYLKGQKKEFFRLVDHCCGEEFIHEIKNITCFTHWAHRFASMQKNYRELLIKFDKTIFEYLLEKSLLSR